MRPLVERLADEELEVHAREQAMWDGLTDCDRLDRAFENLEESGVVARQNFSCCTNCGSTEIWDEAEGGNFDGYVFYHQQDTDGAIEGRELYLSYGSLQREENEEKWAATTLAIANRIVDALQTAGLQPSWNGTIQQKIFLPIDWKKRR